MSYCNQCGEKLEESDTFCPRCKKSTVPANDELTPNAPETTADCVAASKLSTFADCCEAAAELESGEPCSVQPPSVQNTPKKKLNLKLILPIAAAAAAIICAAIFVFAAPSSPHQVFASLQKKSLVFAMSKGAGAYFDKFDSKPAFSGDITMSFDLSGFPEEEAMIFESMELTAKCDVKKGNSLINFDATIMGKSMLGGCFVVMKDMIGFQFPALDKNYYTMSLDRYQSLIQSSVQQPVGSSGYITTAPTFFENVSGKGARRLVAKYGDILLSAVNSANTKDEKKNVTLFEYFGTPHRVDCTVLTFCPSEKDIEAMLSRLVEKLRSDKDAANYILPFIPNADGSPIKRSDYEEAWQALLDSFESSASDLARKMAAADFTWTVAYKGSHIYSESIFFTSANETFELRYDSFGDFRKTRADLFCALKDGDLGLCALSKISASGSTLDGTLELAMPHNASYSIFADYSFDLNKKSSLNVPYGKFSLKFDGNVMAMTVEKSENNGSDHEFTIYVDNQSIGFNINTSDKPSHVKAPETRPIDITSYSDAQIKKLLYGMMDEF
ncbi:MAG: zinc ribbon domain-containing protein [Oscillospiraceae bacterium]